MVRFLPIPADERGALRELFEHISETATKKPSKTYSEEFQIVGVLREQDGEGPRSGVRRGHVPLRRGPDPRRRGDGVRPPRPEWAEEGFDSAVVVVDREDAVKDVAKQVEKMDFRPWSLAEFIEIIRMNVLLVSVATAFIAIVALIVAAIGITNTMIMSVLERTHEIGIMKALGARDGHIRLIFVVEGVLMGLVGSGLGLLLAWLTSFPGDSIARSIMEPQTQPSLRGEITGSLLAFPLWLVAGVPALVCLITTLAAWYPASRAARGRPGDLAPARVATHRIGIVRRRASRRGRRGRGPPRCAAGGCTWPAVPSARPNRS